MNFVFALSCVIYYARADGWDESIYPSNQRLYQACLHVESMTVDPNIFDAVDLNDLKIWATATKERWNNG